MRNVLLLTGMVFGLAMVGCSNNTEQLDAFRTENEELRSQYTESQEALQAADSDLQRAQETLRSEQERNGTLQTQLDTQPEVVNVFESIDGVSATMRDKDLALTVASDLLFSSGSASLKKSAKGTLGEVATSLNNRYPDQSIVVMGYTDTDKITKSNFKSNWHLAFDRAWAVRDYLVTMGVNQNRISIESWGPTKPLATKAASRRVDIVIVNE
jgi:flagellar motor protein MotB